MSRGLFYANGIIQLRRGSTMPVRVLLILICLIGLKPLNGWAVTDTRPTVVKSATLSTTRSVPNNLYATITEYYNSALDHYFITSDPGELQALDTGAVAGWIRTGATFGAFVANSNLAAPVCRFYGLPTAGLDSHFYSASSQECTA